MTQRASELLAHVTPFLFLSAERRAALEARLEERRYAPGERLLARGEGSRDVFLLAEGSVECVDEREPAEVLSTIQAGNYFGERAVLFERPRVVTIRAAEPVLAYTLPGRDFLELIDSEPVFAQALATALKDKQGIFLAYRKLFSRLLSLVDQGEFLLSDLTPAYRALHPALHPHLHADEIDTGALSYAVARLPEQVTRTSIYFLTNALPPLYEDPDSKFERTETAARRRAAWQLTPSKTLVLLRDGMSDVTDLLTCLCLYVTEARKLRQRVRDAGVLRELRELSERPDPTRAAALMQGLPFSPAERAGIERIWPKDYWIRLRDVLLHHEDVAVACDHVVDDYNSRASETWVRQIKEEAAKLVDLEDPHLEVHVISSNTHSVANCLSPYLAAKADEILAWGLRERPELAGEPSPERPWGAAWRCKADLVYVTARDYLRAHPAAAAEAERAGAESGCRHLKATAFTGIEVQLFDAARLIQDQTDPEVEVRVPRHAALLINVDYAFGQQATEILANLLFAFGSRVRSVNVLGKAGGLAGHRGQILLPAATLLQTNDELYPLPNRDLSAEVLRALAPDIPVHEGPVLTVAGTLLQDRALLHFYRKIWKCVGLEMEGSFFARTLISAIETRVACPDVQTRFAYYTSDVPLDPEENLSEPMKPWEGVPPLYAITRAVLNGIFATLGPKAACQMKEAPRAAE